ncbi:MAG: glucose-6-phosphate dehydrogenase [Planctomycetota bacterium]|nr:glucose-6-phosphate dehydrogenase [Planctomycetota bacterium]
MNNKPDPCIVVLFGGTGDLAHRKLLPAIYNLHHDRLLPEHFAVCVYARRERNDLQYRNEMREFISQFSRQPVQADWEQLASRIFYVAGEFGDNAGHARLMARLAELDTQCGTRGNRLFYFAVASDFFVPLIQRLAGNGLLQRWQDPPAYDVATGRRALQAPWRRVVLEKPIGHDSVSARQLLTRVAEHAGESQVFRIDHYLGKETVQNIMALRFGNGIFEPLWNRNYVDHVQITVAEAEGIGNRAAYYERAGALRDVVQNHVLQLLCLVAMESPSSMHADDIRNEKVKILHGLRKMTAAQVAGNVVRGQYGPSADGKLPGYRQEQGVAADSATETFVALRCFVDTWRWADVPFLLRTGKRLPRRQTEISVHFRVPPLRLFDQAAAQESCIGNVLRIRIQPDEGLSLELAAKIPGAGMRLKNVAMDFLYERSFHLQTPEAYERLLLDAMLGDATLFPRDDEVLAQWQFIDSVLAGWHGLPLRCPNYFAGTWGPDDAARLLPPCTGGWHMESADMPGRR